MNRNNLGRSGGALWNLKWIERVLSVAWSGGKLGSSYYDSETSQLHLQMDVVETNEFQFLKRVREQVQPHIIITSSKQDQRLLKILHGEEGENNEEPICSTTEVEILPSIDFCYEVCKRRIIALNGLPGMPQHFTDNERDIYMTSLVPLDNVNMVRSAGALIKYIDKKRIGIELEDPATRVPILSLKVFSL